MFAEIFSCQSMTRVFVFINDVFFLFQLFPIMPFCQKYMCFSNLKKNPSLLRCILELCLLRIIVVTTDIIFYLLGLGLVCLFVFLGEGGRGG